jgi:putative DNA primase/helicase
MRPHESPPAWLDDVPSPDPADYGAGPAIDPIPRRSDPTGNKLPTMTVSDVLALPSPRWLLRDLLLQGGLTMVYGAPGAAKSFFALEIAAAVAQGRDVFGRRTIAGTVAYAAGEGVGGLRNRYAAMVAEGRLVEDAPLTLIPRAIDLAVSDADTDALVELLQAMRPSPVLVVVDTVARALGGADEDAEAFGKLIARCDRVRAESGVTVLLVHHAGKDSSKGARGHSSLLGAVDVCAKVEVADGVRNVIGEKVKDGSEGPWASFVLRVIDLGHDDEGEPVSSCVIDAAEAQATNSGRRRKLTGQAGIAFDALVAAINAGGGEPAPPNRAIPPDAVVVPVERWRAEAFAVGLVSPEAPADTKRRAFNRAKVGLVNGGHITCRVIGDLEVCWLGGTTGQGRDMSGTCLGG